MLRWVAFALVAVIVVSALGFVSAANPRAAPASHARTLAAPAVTMVSIQPTDQFGVAQPDFWVGYSGGNVYFTATDTSGETSATVAINDQNVTRDGLPANPQKSWTVSFAGGTTNTSSNWGGHFLLPIGLKYGGQWNITIRGTMGGFAATNFTVHVYDVFVDPVQPAVLDSHPFTVTWNLQWSVNSAPYANATSVTLLATWFNGVTVKAIPGTPVNLSKGAFGWWNLTTPATATGGISIDIWANTTVGTTHQSERGSNSIQTATLNAPDVTLANCPSVFGCGGNTFPNGTPVYVIAGITMNGFYAGTYPAAGLGVKFAFENNGLVVAAPGDPPANLSSNASGGAAVLFIADAPPFSIINPNEVVVTVTDPLAPSTSLSTTATFAITAVLPQTPRLQVVLGSAQYYGGDTVSATWTLWGPNSTVTNGWSVDYWVAQDLTTSTLLGQGLLSGGAGTGTFSFGLPANLAGRIYVYVHAHNATSDMTSFPASATVTAPAILLSPSEQYYQPGDSITVSIATFGSALASASFFQTVSDSSGVTWANGPLSGNQIHLTIPAVGTPSNVLVSVAAQTPTGGLIASSQLTLYQAYGYVLVTGVTTASNYVDNSYQPGQTIQVSYNVKALGSATLPKTYTIWVFTTGGAFGSSGWWSAQTSSASGTIPITIPKGAQSGSIAITVVAIFGVCGAGCSASSQFSLSVNANPSALSYQLGAGSGLTVGWLILFLLIIAVVIVIVVMMRRRGRPMMMRPESSKSASWSESSSSTPPSGASQPGMSSDSGSKP